MSIEETDRASAAVAVAPRVSLDDIKAAIKAVHFVNAFDAVEATTTALENGLRSDSHLKFLTVCFVEMTNGFIAIGKSAPASPENFNEELGRKFSYEDAIRQLWPLMAFSLLDRLSND
jgi:hypothetical protein